MNYQMIIYQDEFNPVDDPGIAALLGLAQWLRAQYQLPMSAVLRTLWFGTWKLQLHDTPRPVLLIMPTQHCPEQPQERGAEHHLVISSICRVWYAREQARLVLSPTGTDPMHVELADPGSLDRVQDWMLSKVREHFFVNHTVLSRHRAP